MPRPPRSRRSARTFRPPGSTAGCCAATGGGRRSVRPASATACGWALGSCGVARDPACRPPGYPRCRLDPRPRNRPPSRNCWCCGLRGAARHETSRCRASRSEEHTSELQSPCNLVCRLLLEKKKQPPPVEDPDALKSTNMLFRSSLLTVLVVDIRDFTGLAQRMDAYKLSTITVTFFREAGKA